MKMKSATSFDEDDNYFRSLPKGLRFDPRDDKIIEGYLIKKLNGLKLPRNRIKEVNLYDYPTPETLVENRELIREKAWYFFTPRKKKYLNGKRPDRSTSGGVWRATLGEAEIRNKGNIVVGYKQTLKFFAKNPNHHQTNNARTTDGWVVSTDWLMHEYRVIDETKRTRNRDAMTLDDCVLCKVYKKPSEVEKPDKSSNSMSRNTNKRKRMMMNNANCDSAYDHDKLSQQQQQQCHTDQYDEEPSSSSVVINSSPPLAMEHDNNYRAADDQMMIDYSPPSIAEQDDHRTAHIAYLHRLLMDETDDVDEELSIAYQERFSQTYDELSNLIIPNC